MSAPKLAVAAPAQSPVGQTAAEVAGWAQARAGVTVRELDDASELTEASDVFQAIWGKRFDLGAPINADLLRALGHAGNYVAGAFDAAGTMQGALVAFIGVRDGHTHLHSHILGVLPSNQVRGAGFALKVHQRWWALDRGYDTIEWTFDPLVRRNGYFNLTKLGAEIDSYFVNFYGVMNDQQNHQEESDRVLLRWDLRSERTLAAMAGTPRDSLGGTEGGQLVHVLDAAASGDPVVREAEGARLIALHTPDDIVAMRREAPPRARRWRQALRDTMIEALARGYRCEGVSRAGDYLMRLSAGS
jgi:predicted GNAT superfamily acetyltransferase